MLYGGALASNLKVSRIVIFIRHSSPFLCKPVCESAGTWLAGN
jgi:hypothetical protein